MHKRKQKDRIKNDITHQELEISFLKIYLFVKHNADKSSHPLKGDSIIIFYYCI